MDWPSYDAVTFLGAVHAGGRVEVRGTEVWVVLRGGLERTLAPADLDDLERRGWLAIGETVEVTPAGRYWAARCVRAQGRRLGLGPVRLVRAGALTPDPVPPGQPVAG